MCRLNICIKMDFKHAPWYRNLRSFKLVRKFPIGVEDGEIYGLVVIEQMKKIIIIAIEEMLEIALTVSL